MCAAIWLDDGEKHPFQPTDTGLVYCGYRHPCILAQLPEGYDKTRATQGFLTTRNRFVTRQEAFDIACRTRQILAPSLVRGRRLTSEDLW